VKDGINGYAFPPAAGAEIYAGKIEQLVSDRHGMQTLKLSSRNYYEENLNWDVWGQQFQQIGEQLAKRKRRDM
jgi:glycosyltransferase involved in cell wall biosynthesis